MKFISDKERLSKVLSKAPEKCKEILESHQNMILSLVGTLQALKEKQKESQLEELGRKLQGLEQRAYYQQQSKLVSGANYSPSRRQALRSQPPEMDQIRVLPEEEVKKLKGDYLSTKEKKESLLKAMGFSLDDGEPVSPSKDPALGDLNFDEAKFSIRDKLKALKENKGKKKVLKPLQKLRGMARVVTAFFLLKSSAVKNVGKMKEEQQVYLTHDINLHLDIARAWLLQSMRSVILSVFFAAFSERFFRKNSPAEQTINDSGLHMNIVKTSLSEDELNTRLLRIQVRIKAILEALLVNTDSVQGKGPIFKFLHRLTTPGKFIPDEYLWDSEKAHLALDLHGRILYLIFLRGGQKTV